MKGLLIKDIQLLLQRKQTIVIFFAVCMIMGYTTEDSFVIGYMAFLSAILAISTISYDEADNGLVFLMTLPASRQEYVFSKYILGALFGVGAGVLSSVLLLAIQLFKGLPVNAAEIFTAAVTYLPLCLLMLDLMIPLQLKFGPERSRIVMLIVFGGITALGFTLGKSPAGDALNVSATEIMDRLSPSGITVGAAVLTALLTAVSMALAVRVMKKKSF